MNKDAMIHIINQHGLDVLYDVISDEISNIYYEGYEKGLSDGSHIGWCECYDMMSDDD